MRRIYKIAKAELATLFYSPVAWFIWVVFAFQVGMTFVGLIGEKAQASTLGYEWGFQTATLLGGMRGLYTIVQQYLYLYMPLLTMSLMSREYSSGSIKLLYASPVTSTHIILGKFLSMMLYGLVLLGVLFVMVLFAGCVIPNFGFKEALVGLLGLYLLLCAYASIGLFVSSLTSYQVVAGIGTLVILAALNYVNQVGQSYDFVRDITYWLCISGRSEEMIAGLICSEDVIYFIAVSAMFLSLTILRLNSTRQYAPKGVMWGKYLGVIAVTCLIGYITSRPMMMCFYDSTETKRMTLTPVSQEIMKKLEDGMTITTYVNYLDRDAFYGWPTMVNEDKKRFKQYLRFKPDIKMKYVYYYDTVATNPWLMSRYPGKTIDEIAKEESEKRDWDVKKLLTPKQIKKIIDLEPEGNVFVRLVERKNGQKAFLRLFNDMEKHPSEAEIGVTFKRFVMDMPKVGFLTGHGEPSITGERKRDYLLFAGAKNFRHSLLNQGFDTEEVSISGDSDIPGYINILVIADMNAPLNPEEMSKLNKYIERGGNLLIAGGAGKQDIMNPIVEPFGVRMLPGTLVQKKVDILPNSMMLSAVPETVKELSYHYEFMWITRGWKVNMKDAVGLDYTTDKGFTVQELLRTDSTGCWNEMETRDFVNDSVVLNPAAGEIERMYPTALALSRKIGDREQRIMILGNASCISNDGVAGERGVPVANYPLVTGTFHWFSYGEAPLDVRRPSGSDVGFRLKRPDMPYVKIVFMGVIPVVLLLWGTILWIRRKRN